MGRSLSGRAIGCSPIGRWFNSSTSLKSLKLHLGKIFAYDFLQTAQYDLQSINLIYRVLNVFEIVNNFAQFANCKLNLQIGKLFVYDLQINKLFANRLLRSTKYHTN